MTTLNTTKNKLFYFEHQAMATQFSIQLMHHDKTIAAAVAEKCFERIDELELKLSRFIPDSDISRINKMESGTDMLLDMETYECLKAAIEVMQITGGIFDIGTAQMTDVFKGFKKGILNSIEYKNALEKVFEEKQKGSLFVDPENPKIYCIEEGIKIDLGGIGKGYALDQLNIILQDYGIDDFALNAGDSSILVKSNTDQKPYWEYTIANLEQEEKVQLKNTAVSASGFYWNDKHIFDPLTGRNDRTPEFERIWVSTPNAAYSDAFSTAFFLMNEREIEKIHGETSLINWIRYSKDGNIYQIK